MHEAPELLVVVNVWDAVSAGTAAGVEGVQALATTSHAIAGAHGYPDGEVIPRAEMVEAIALVCRHAGGLPVSADLERGYGETPADVAETVAMTAEAGAVGCNIEDGLPDGGLRPLDDSVARVAAARRAAPDFVLNARTDEFLFGAKDLALTIARGRAFLDAGADCFFVPGAREPETLAALGREFHGRLSILVNDEWPMPDLPGIDVARLTPDLAGLGITRVSFGPFGQRHAMLAFADYTRAIVS